MKRIASACAALAALAAFSAAADDVRGICTKDNLTGESVVVTNASLAIGDSLAALETAIEDSETYVMKWVIGNGYASTNFLSGKTVMLAPESNRVQRIEVQSTDWPAVLARGYEVTSPGRTSAWGTYYEGDLTETNAVTGMTPLGLCITMGEMFAHYPGGTLYPDSLHATNSVLLVGREGLRFMRRKSDSLDEHTSSGPFGPAGLYGYGTGVFDYEVLWPPSPGRFATEEWVEAKGYIDSYEETDGLFQDFRTNATELAIGRGASATGYTTATLSYAGSAGTAVGMGATVVYAGPRVGSLGGVAIGLNAKAGANDEANGKNVIYNDVGSVAIGRNATADGQSVSIGASKASGGSIVISNSGGFSEEGNVVIGNDQTGVYGYSHFGRSAYDSVVIGSGLACTNRRAVVIGKGDSSPGLSFIYDDDGNVTTNVVLTGSKGRSHGDDTFNVTAPDLAHVYIGDTSLCDRLKLVIDAMVSAGVMTSDQGETVKGAIE